MVKFEGDNGWIQAGWNTSETNSRDVARQAQQWETQSRWAEVGFPLESGQVHLRTCRQGEHRDFLNCVKSRKETYAPAEIGHRTASVCHLGNICLLRGRKPQWDPEKELTDDDDANKMLSRRMRSPWRLEA